MDTIGKMALKNDGAFVVRYLFNYLDQDGKQQHTVAVPSPGIKTDQDDTANPGSLGVPDGAETWLHAEVIWGDHKTAHEHFIYQADNPATAVYKVTGTTRDVHLRFKGIE